jgi:hypothetical protein
MIIDDVQSFARDFINIKSFRTSTRKTKIREAYRLLTGKEIKVSCSTCYIEALLFIVNSKPMAAKNYELKRGVLLQAFGDASKTCTNDTLTDELAEWYLKNQPEKIIYFSRLPAGMKAEQTPSAAPTKLFQTSTKRNFAQRSKSPPQPQAAVAPKIVIIPPKAPEEIKIVPPEAVIPKKVVKKAKK